MEEKRVRLTGIQRKTAQKMVESVQNIPHVTTIREVNLKAVAARREVLKKSLGKVTYIPFILEGVLRGLEKFPVLNARLDGNEIVYYENRNLGVAVSVDGKLMVPVIHNVQKMEFPEIVKSVNELTERAREKKLTLEDFSEGTFTVSNSGAFGGEIFTPIINYPESALLGIGKIKKKVIVNENDEIEICPMMYLCLSYDHRIINGSQAVQFLGVIEEFLNSPDV